MVKGNTLTVNQQKHRSGTIEAVMVCPQVLMIDSRSGADENQGGIILRLKQIVVYSGIFGSLVRINPVAGSGAGQVVIVKTVPAYLGRVRGGGIEVQAKDIVGENIVLK